MKLLVLQQLNDWSVPEENCLNVRLGSVHIGLCRALESCRVENILHNVNWMQNWYNSKIAIWCLYYDWSKNTSTASTTSHNNGTLAFSQNTPHQMPLLSDAAVIFFSSIAALTANVRLFILNLQCISSTQQMMYLLNFQYNIYTFIYICT
jgi:hypothetical protein